MSTTETIADSVNKLMFEQGKKNKDLAEMLGVTPIQASNIRRGMAPIGVDNLFKIADWLGVSTDDLARGYKLLPTAA